MSKKRERKNSEETDDIAMHKSDNEEEKLGTSSKNAAAKYSDDHVSFFLRYIQKKETKEDSSYNNEILSADQQIELAKYLKSCTDTHFGVSPIELLRKISFEYITKKNWTLHPSWEGKGSVGEDWFRAFLIREQNAASRSRTESLFHKLNSRLYSTAPFTKLQDIMKRFNITETHIFNVNEIRITPIKNPLGIGTESGFVTAVFTASATGEVILPYFIFPTGYSEAVSIRRADSNDATVESDSKGSMSEKSFLEFFKYFTQEIEVSVSDKILLVLDDHTSHIINMNTLDFCRENGILLLSSSKQQALRRFVLPSFRKSFNQACGLWTLKNTGRQMTLQDIPEIVAKVMPLSFTQTNILRGFLETGVNPVESIAASNDCCDNETDDEPTSHPVGKLLGEGTDLDNQKERASNLIVFDDDRIYIPRRRRKTTRGTYDISLYKGAYQEVKAGTSLRNAALKYSINHVSLSRYIKKRDARGDGSGEEIYMGYNTDKKILSLSQESELTKYLWTCTDTHFGGSLKELLKKISFDYITKKKWARHPTWESRRTVGDDWFRSFLIREKHVASRSRIESLSHKLHGRPAVPSAHTNFKIIMSQFNITQKNIFNAKEMRLFAFENPPTNGAESGFVTAVFTANACGDVVPPYYLFPAEHFQVVSTRRAESNDASIGSDGNGSMGEKSLLEFLKYFTDKVEVSTPDKILLILDDYTSHINMNTLDFCRENGIVLLSSSKQQPLRRSVLPIFKESFRTACDSWMLQNGGKHLTLEDIPQIVADVMPQAFTEANILRGFLKTHVYPVENSAAVNDSCDQEKENEVYGPKDVSSDGWNYDDVKIEGTDFQEQHIGFDRASSSTSIVKIEELDAETSGCDLFGKYVAKELRNLPIIERLELQEEIRERIGVAKSSTKID